MIEADHADFLVSQLDKELHGLVSRQLIINLYGWNLIFIRMRRHQHKRNSAIHQLLIILRIEHVTCEHDPIHLLLMESVDIGQHPLLVTVGIADHQAVAELNAGILHPADHSCKIQVLNIGNEQAKCKRLLVD
ncbi:hypothetical protein D3C80_1541490 [compost metagenome]